MATFVVTGLPYTYSSVMTYTLRNTPNALLFGGSMAINQITWSGIGTAGDSFTVLDQAGATLASHTASAGDVAAGNYTAYYPSSLRCTDYQLTVLSSGTVTLIVDWLILGSPVGSVPTSILGIAVPYTSPSAGNFTVAHTLGRVPSLAVIQQKAPPFGEVQFQTTPYDAANLYLYASDTGLTGVVWIS